MKLGFIAHTDRDGSVAAYQRLREQLLRLTQRYFSRFWLEVVGAGRQISDMMHA